VIRDGNQHADPGDASGVLRVYLHWAPDVVTVTRAPLGSPPLCHVKRTEGHPPELVFSLDRGNGRRQVHFVPLGSGDAEWPIVQLGPTTWDLPMSILIPGQFHGFATLVEVPCLPPWGML
jgi:hypothetical protein